MRPVSFVECDEICLEAGKLPKGAGVTDFCAITDKASSAGTSDAVCRRNGIHRTRCADGGQGIAIRTRLAKTSDFNSIRGIAIVGAIRSILPRRPLHYMVATGKVVRHQDRANLP